METAGAEALSVFPSENPSWHIRISTAKKVCWDFVLCSAWWFPGASCLPGFLGQNKARHPSWVTRTTWGRFQITFLKQVGLGKDCMREHSQRKSWMWSFITQFVLSECRYESGGASRGEWVWFNQCQQALGGLSPKGALKGWKWIVLSAA